MIRALLANKLGDNKWIPLPPVTHSKISPYTIDELVARVDNIVRLSIFNTAHPCLYYSYARCRVLRKSGYPVKLNIGLHNVKSKIDVEGHCWLSLDGEVLFEEKAPLKMYPDMMGEKNDVVYWVRLNTHNDKKIRREKV